MERRELDVASLLLDPQNPRLPEELQGADQSALLAHLFNTAALEELAISISDNAFFAHEPLFVVQEGSSYVVVEGNRRLATVQVLLQTPTAAAADVAFDENDIRPSAKIKSSLVSLPCYVVADRAAVRTFLGFRHIGGIKTWSAEAKARYLFEEVTASAKADKKRDPFYVVGRRVGSNSQGVRTPVVALMILREASREYGIKRARDVQHTRFGVWQRCMSAPELMKYIGFNGARTYDECVGATRKLREEPLREVLGDLLPQPGAARAIVADSRQVTTYGKVLADPSAHTALRRYGDLQLAAQIIDRAELPARVRRLQQTVRILLPDLAEAEVSSELTEAVDGLRLAVQSLVDLLNGKAQPR